MRSYRKTAASDCHRSGGKGDIQKDVSLSHISTGIASRIEQDKGLISNGLKEDAPLATLLKRAVAVADRQDETIADLASLSLQYANLMNRDGGKEIVLQPWPCGSWWLMIRDAKGSGSRLEHQGSFADAYKLALLHSVYNGDDVRGAPINIAGCRDE